MLGPWGDPLTLWPFPGKQEDLEILSQDQAEKEDPLRGWRRNRGRKTQRGMAAQKPRAEGAAQKGRSKSRGQRGPLIKAPLVPQWGAWHRIRWVQSPVAVGLEHA